VTTLAAQGSPAELYVANGSVYWTDESSAVGGLWEVSVNGGAAVQLAEAGQIAEGVWVNSTTAYFGVGTTVYQTPLSNPSGTLAFYVGSPSVNGLDSNGTYMCDSQPGVISIPLSGGGQPQTLDTANTDWKCVFAGASVYWTNSTAGTIGVAPAIGGAATVFASGQAGARGIASDGTYLYWSTVPPSGTGAIYQYALSKTGTTTTLVTGLTRPNAIATDGSFVYSYGLGTEVWKVPVGGGTVVPLANLAAGDEGNSIVVDATSVYWVTRDKAIMKVNK
jgi:hypothetical protein